MQNRLKKVKEAMNTKGVSALLVTKSENQIYLTGFHSSNYQLIITADTNYLLTDFRYIEAAGELAPLYYVVLTDHNVTLYTFLKELGIKELAIEDSSISYAEFKQLEEKVGCHIVSGDGIVEGVRVIKDEYELEAIRKAQEIADMAFTHMLNYLKPGITEVEAALELERFLRRHGAQGLSFDTILVSGVRTSLPHGIPSQKKLENEDFITMDFGCIVEGYRSDMTRTVALGKATPEQREIYSIVLEAQKAGCDAIRAGLSCKEADKVCRDIITDRGYGAFFGHGTGHGVGLEIHEAPTLNGRSEEVLEENMVVTVEPGIYLPQKFGVRIEDLAIVTASGIINLVKSDKELIVI
jgi:Xaa-Pro aminopeptidase